MAPKTRANRWVMLVCVLGPALVALIPLAPAPALMAMAAHFHMADSRLFSQVVMTLPAIMLVMAAPLSGWLSAKVGKRRVLLASLLLYTVTGAGVLGVGEWHGLVALRLLLGVSGGGILTASLGLIGDHFSSHERERVLGYATSLASLVAALALIYGGRLVDMGGWQAPFGLYLFAAPVFAIAFAAIHDVPLTGSDKRSPAVVSQLLHVWPYYAILVLLTLGMFTPAIQAGFVLQAKGIGSAQTVGSILASCSVVAIFSAWSFGWLRARIGLHGFLAINALSMGVGILTIGLADHVGVVFVGCAIVGIGAGMSEPAIASIVFARTGQSVHAMAMGMIVSAINLGQFINPLLFAPLEHMWGISTAFTVVGGTLTLMALVIAIRHPEDLLERK